MPSEGQRLPRRSFAPACRSADRERPCEGRRRRRRLAPTQAPSIRPGRRNHARMGPWRLMIWRSKSALVPKGCWSEYRSRGTFPSGRRQPPVRLYRLTVRTGPMPRDPTLSAPSSLRLALRRRLLRPSGDGNIQHHDLDLLQDLIDQSRSIGKDKPAVRPRRGASFGGFQILPRPQQR